MSFELQHTEVDGFYSNLGVEIENAYLNGVLVYESLTLITVDTTYTSSATIIVPTYTTITLIGKGANGSSYYSSAVESSAWGEKTWYDEVGNGINALVHSSGGVWPSSFNGATLTQVFQLTDGNQQVNYGTYPNVPRGVLRSFDGHGARPASSSTYTGAASTASISSVIKTFAGGYGGTATTSTQTIDTSSGTSLSLVIPSSGSIRVQYSYMG